MGFTHRPVESGPLMRVDFIATQSHFVDHLLPVWWALREEERGSWHVPNDLHPLLRVNGVKDPVRSGRGDVALSASWPDVRGARQYQQRVLMEHGSGQSYHDERSPHYAGGWGRDAVNLFLAPNDRVLRLNSDVNPKAEHALVGTPKLDVFFTHPLREPEFDVAVSFHWRCRVCPETTSGFDFFKPAVLELAKRFDVRGHAHPRLWGEASEWYRRSGITTLPHFGAVLSSCGVYVCDNSSTIYEFAAVGKPVVVLNPPTYRKWVEHGLRFWEYADVGLQCDDPDLLPSTVELAMQDPEHVRERRHEVTEALYPYRDGKCAERAVEAIRSLSVV